MTTGRMPTVISFGYQGQTPQVLKELADRSNAVVFDCRHAPFSKLPEWNKRNLQRVLGAAYVHAPGFGNVNYQGGGPITLKDPDREMVWVREHFDSGKDAIVMCACRSHTSCHRKEVSELISRELGAALVVWHPRDTTQRGLFD